jgi:hypothetical protein
MSVSREGPLVSIAMAAYNREQLVVRAVRSALAQTHGRVEVIVSDDHSGDRTVELLEAIGDARLRVVAHPAHVGVWENWTAAVRGATGEFLVFLGDDDYLSSTFVADHLAVFAAHPEVAVVFSPYQEETLAGEKGRLFEPPFPPGTVISPDAFFEAVVGMRLFFGSAVFRRAEAVAVWETTRPDDLSADHGMLMRLALKSRVRVAACPAKGYFKTAHAGSLSAKFILATTGLRNVLWRVRAEGHGSEAQRRLLARLGALETVTLARHHAALRDLAAARREFALAVRTCPTLPVAWRQWAMAWLLPGRVIRTARAQRGLPAEEEGTATAAAKAEAEAKAAARE